MESDCLYPNVPTAPTDDEGQSFRLQKICDIQTALKSKNGKRGCEPHSINVRYQLGATL